MALASSSARTGAATIRASPATRTVAKARYTVSLLRLLLQLPRKRSRCRLMNGARGSPRDNVSTGKPIVQAALGVAEWKDGVKGKQRQVKPLQDRHAPIERRNVRVDGGDDRQQDGYGSPDGQRSPQAPQASA